MTADEIIRRVSQESKFLGSFLEQADKIAFGVEGVSIWITPIIGEMIRDEALVRISQILGVPVFLVTSEGTRQVGETHAKGWKKRRIKR